MALLGESATPPPMDRNQEGFEWPSLNVTSSATFCVSMEPQIPIGLD